MQMADIPPDLVFIESHMEPVYIVLGLVDGLEMLLGFVEQFSEYIDFVLWVTVVQDFIKQQVRLGNTQARSDERFDEKPSVIGHMFVKVEDADNRSRYDQCKGNFEHVDAAQNSSGFGKALAAVFRCWVGVRSVIFHSLTTQYNNPLIAIKTAP